MRNKQKSRAMGKWGQLAMALAWTAITLVWGVQMLQTVGAGTPSNAPGWPMYALVAAGSALCAVCWFVSWLRYNRSHQEK